MTRFLLIRHGGTGFFGLAQKPSTGLNVDGGCEMRKLATSLTEAGASKIFASPYQRALDSAKIVSDALNLPIETDERLIEIDLWEDLVQMKAESNLSAGLEKLRADREKILAVLDEYRDQNTDQNIIVVGHGNWLRAAMGITLDMPVESIVRLSVPLASVTVLEYDERGFYRLFRFGSAVFGGYFKSS